MSIEPLEHIVYLKLDKVKAGVLDTSSRSTAVEFAEVEAVGLGVKQIKKGDKLFVKSWGIDTVSHAGEKYYFVNINTGAILAIVQ